jgi:hypothetical protein
MMTNITIYGAMRGDTGSDTGLSKSDTGLSKVTQVYSGTSNIYDYHFTQKKRINNKVTSCAFS